MRAGALFLFKLKIRFPFSLLTCLNVVGSRSAMLQLRGGDEGDDSLDMPAPAWSRESVLFLTEVKPSEEGTGDQQTQNQGFHLC